MNNTFKIWAIAMIMALLLATAAAPLLAESGSGGSDSSGGSGSGSDDSDKAAKDVKDASSSDASSNSKDQAKVDDIKNADEKKVEVTVKEDKNKQTAEIRVKNGDAKTEVKVKADAKTGFAGFISRLIASIFGRDEKTSSPEAANSGSLGSNEAVESEVTTPAPGITIDKTLSSGPGYPTGPLDISLPPTQLLLDRVGQVKAGEIKDRQYEVEFAAVPVTINGVAYTATEVKVISNLKTKAGAGQHSGTIDVDIDVPLGSTLPAGHITLEYKGSAIVSGTMISSGGVFKTSKMTGIFAGLVSEGTYSMTIIESGQTLGSPATVSITTTSSI